MQCKHNIHTAAAIEGALAPIPLNFSLFLSVAALVLSKGFKKVAKHMEYQRIA